MEGSENSAGHQVMFRFIVEMLFMFCCRRHGGVDAELAARLLNTHPDHPDHPDHPNPSGEVTDGGDGGDDEPLSAEILLSAILPPPPPSLAQYLLEGVTKLQKGFFGVSPSPSRSPQHVTNSRSFLPMSDKADSTSNLRATKEPEVFFNKEDSNVTEQVPRYENVHPEDETDRSYGIGVAGEALGREYR